MAIVPLLSAVIILSAQVLAYIARSSTNDRVAERLRQQIMVIHASPVPPLPLDT